MWVEGEALARSNSLPDVLAQAIEAHGGAARWRSLAAVEAELSVRGLLFTMKQRPVLRHIRVRADARQPSFTFFDYPRPGQSCQFLGEQEVRILDSAGNVVASRANPREAFHSLRRQFHWDALDFAYFGGYATWNYLVTPFLFLREGFTFQEMTPPPDLPQGWSLIGVIFPENLPTHSPRQVFYFDERHLLRRLDYVAQVVGGWARAAHLCDEYREFQGIQFPTRRRVRPLLMGPRPMPGPTLVAIDIHDVRLVEG